MARLSTVPVTEFATSLPSITVRQEALTLLENGPETPLLITFNKFRWKADIQETSAKVTSKGTQTTTDWVTAARTPDAGGQSRSGHTCGEGPRKDGRQQRAPLRAGRAAREQIIGDDAEDNAARLRAVTHAGSCQGGYADLTRPAAQETGRKRYDSVTPI